MPNHELDRKSSTVSAVVISSVLVVPALTYVPSCLAPLLHPAKSLMIRVCLLVAAAYLLVSLWGSLSGTLRIPRCPKAQRVSLLLFALFLTLSLTQAASVTPLLQSWLWWLNGICLFLMLPSFLTTDSQRNAAIELVVAAGVFVAVFNLMCFFRTGALDGLGCLSLLQSRNITAQFLIFPLLLAWFKLRTERGPGKLLFGLCAVLILVCIIATRSRAVWIGLLLAWMFEVRAQFRHLPQFRLGKIILSLFLIVLVILGLDLLARAHGQPGLGQVFFTFLRPLEGSAGGRLRLWLNSLGLVRDHFLFGVGIGNWNEVYYLYANSIVRDPATAGPFNSQLQLLGEIGVIGCSAFLFLIWDVVRKSYLSSRADLPALRMALIALFTASLFHSTFDVAILQINFWWVLGLLRTDSSEVEEEPSQFSVRAAIGSFALIFVVLSAAFEIRFLQSKFYTLVVDAYLDYSGDDPEIKGPWIFQIRGLRPWLRDVFYRQNPQPMLKLGPYSNGDWWSRNLFLTIAKKEAGYRNFKTALKWLYYAERRSPNNPDISFLRCIWEMNWARQESIAVSGHQLSVCEIALSKNRKLPERKHVIEKLMLQEIP